ncbi:MAG: hypothetical protein ACD_21C00034G0006 [uncultured bacterium]|nr:MAG: hypothetical protein ACD_21C00034G0006 [uncultured bacterium]
MGYPNIISADFVSETMKQQMLQINNDISHLLELVKDPQRYGELIQLLDPTMDKVNLHTTSLQTKLAEELDRKSKKFEQSISPLDDPVTLTKTPPPRFLSAVDKAKWNELAKAKASIQQLADFKKLLVTHFKDEASKQPQVKKLMEQNVAIKQILDKIRQTLMI